MHNNKKSSPSMASEAAKILTNSDSSGIAKKLAGSVLSQANSSNQTGKAMETIASNVLKSEKYSSQTKDLAASVLSQSNKDR